MVRAALVAASAALAFALIFPLLYDALAPTPAPPPVRLGEPPAGRYTIRVANWGYHTSIVLPQPPGWTLGPPGRERAPYVEYAWGDRGFYRDSDFRPHAVFATLVLPTPSVAYVAGRATPPAARDGARAVYAREVDGRGLRALAAELERTIRHDAAGRRAPPDDPVAGYPGRFYDAYGSYLWTRDCNRWTVDRLAAAGLARPGGLVVLAGQVAGRLRGFRPVPR